MTDKAMFQSCLVAMHPTATKANLSSGHDVTTYIHNAFLKFIDNLKTKFQVSTTWMFKITALFLHTVSKYQPGLNQNRSVICQVDKGQLHEHNCTLDPQTPRQQNGNFDWMSSLFSFFFTTHVRISHNISLLSVSMLGSFQSHHLLMYFTPLSICFWNWH